MIELKNLLFKGVPAHIILALHQNGRMKISELPLHVETTYAHAFNTVKRLELQGVVNTVKVRRDRMIRLTPYGTMVADELEKLIKTIDEADNNVSRGGYK